jgi:spermidine synthase
VILIDSTDPVGPGAVLFTQEFYADCKRCLTPGGVMANQGGVPLLQADELRMILTNLAPSFAVATAYTTVVPTYHGGFMTLGYATDDPSRVWLTADEATARANTSLGADALAALAYYTPDHHPAAFALPKFIRDIVGG